MWEIKVGEVLEIIDKSIVYLDGVKIKANANSHKNIFYNDIKACEIAKLDKNFLENNAIMEYLEYDDKLNLSSLKITENEFYSVIERLNKKPYIINEKTINNIIESKNTLLNYQFEYIKNQTMSLKD